MTSTPSVLKVLSLFFFNVGLMKPWLNWTTKGFKEYSLSVDIFDPLINEESYLIENKIKLSKKLTKYDGIVLAVPHDEIIEINLKNLMKDSKTVIFDVKGALKNPEYYQLWSITSQR